MSLISTRCVLHMEVCRRSDPRLSGALRKPVFCVLWAGRGGAWLV